MYQAHLRMQNAFSKMSQAYLGTFKNPKMSLETPNETKLLNYLTCLNSTGNGRLNATLTWGGNRNHWASQALEEKFLHQIFAHRDLKTENELKKIPTDFSVLKVMNFDHFKDFGDRNCVSAKTSRFSTLRSFEKSESAVQSAGFREQNQHESPRSLKWSNFNIIRTENPVDVFPSEVGI